MAQLEVGHGRRLASIRAALSCHPRIALAGAPYDGIGVAACMRSAERAARALAA